MDGEARASNAPIWRDGLFIWALLLEVVSILFGGGSRENPIRLATVEICSLPLLLLGLHQLWRPGALRGLTLPLTVLALLVLVPLLQLVPLPAGVWSSLPGRATEVEALRTAGLSLASLPLTLSPGDTLSSAMALLAPAAMFVGALTLSARAMRVLVVVWIGFGLASLVLGAAQMFGGDTSPAYLYPTTNAGSLVGFFANRNHEADYLLALLPFAAAVVARADMTGRRGVLALVTALYFLLAIAGLAAVKSRAGIILVAPVLIAAGALILRSPTGRRRGRTLAVVGGISLAALVIVVLFGLGPLLQRFGHGAPDETRAENWPYVEQAANTYLPVGTGVGSFDRVFRSVEPLKLVSPSYFNHAHNDYLETWLETGWMGMAVLALFAYWFFGAARAAWSRDGRFDPDLARAASLAVALMLAHSFVDYPLRTTTLMTLFAFCCAVLAVHARSLVTGSRVTAPAVSARSAR